MRKAVLRIHPGLAGGSRLPWLAREDRGLEAAEILLLLGMGAVAAMTTAFLELGLRVPGHAILRAVFPMALGMALVPRQFAGSTMGLGALASAAVLKLGGSTALGVGAMTSLLLTGPMLDLALARAKRGWRLYLGFALAGLASNLAAFAVRGGAKGIGLDHLAARPLAEWWLVAAGTYALCGILAGLLSAAVWFRLSRDRGGSVEPEARV